MWFLECLVEASPVLLLVLVAYVYTQSEENDDVN